jgi:hypothetical protein
MKAGLVERAVAHVVVTAMSALDRLASLFSRVVLLCIAAALVNSCGGGDDASGTAPRGPIVGGAAPGEAICTGDDLSKLTSKVYVSTTGTDTDGCGTSTTKACASIDKGIAACAASGCGVLVRHGLYQTITTLHLRDGVDVLGGCRFDGEPDRGYRTVIQAAPAAGTPAVSADSINSATLFSHIVVVGKDETAKGTASIAMFVRSSNGLVLTGATLVAGRGGAGQDGLSATDTTKPGGNGVQGAPFQYVGGMGGPSCPSNPPGDGSGNGGAGGTSQYLLHDCTQRGVLESGRPSGSVAGGAPGDEGAMGPYCNGSGGFIGPSDGNPGRDGSAGSCGAPVAPSVLTAGSLSGFGWVAAKGDDGQAGAVGSGGGGGGDGGFCAALPRDNPDKIANVRGLPGGGGGGGGCGGASGGGAQQGGASLALVVVDSPLTRHPQWSTNTLVPSIAGNAGKAGEGRGGGAGGGGGGGQSEGKINFAIFLCGGSGGPGGSGGYGGAGSGGAGGNGGPSIGLAYAGTTPPPLRIDGIYAPAPGTPGAGATGGTAAPVAGSCKGADGPAGLPGAGALAFQLDPAANPPTSLLTAGAQLGPGQSRTSPDGTVQFVMQADSNLCLYKSGIYQWCSFTNGLGAGTTATMQTDGNLCLLSSVGNTHCVLPPPSGSVPPPWSYLQVSNDGHVVVTDGAKVYWQAPP